MGRKRKISLEDFLEDIAEENIVKDWEALIQNNFNNLAN